jgi:glycosyltransferase involved in cell wall biosynthesis
MNTRVSVVLPTLNCEKYIVQTIESIIGQTFNDFEVIVVNEYGSMDNTKEIIESYCDSRIIIHQNAAKLGLAESLNLGIRIASGEYIARADADDIYSADRLQRQVDYLDSHPGISVCGTWQHHFGNIDRVHRPQEKHEDIKARLLFSCDICHSTLMFRKKDFIVNGLWYNPEYDAEDYELWLRAIDVLKFGTIPAVLCEYRWNGNNITQKKAERIEDEARILIANNLKNHLGVSLLRRDLVLVSDWANPFIKAHGLIKIILLKRELDLLKRIKHANDIVNYYDTNSLKRALRHRWEWALGHEDSSGMAWSVQNEVLYIVKLAIKELWYLLRSALSLGK